MIVDEFFFQPSTTVWLTSRASPHTELKTSELRFRNASNHPLDALNVESLKWAANFRACSCNNGPEIFYFFIKSCTGTFLSLCSINSIFCLNDNRLRIVFLFFLTRRHDETIETVRQLNKKWNRKQFRFHMRSICFIHSDTHIHTLSLNPNRLRRNVMTHKHSQSLQTISTTNKQQLQSISRIDFGKNNEHQQTNNSLIRNVFDLDTISNETHFILLLEDFHTFSYWRNNSHESSNYGSLNFSFFLLLVGSSNRRCL